MHICTVGIIIFAASAADKAAAGFAVKAAAVVFGRAGAETFIFNIVGIGAATVIVFAAIAIAETEIIGFIVVTGIHEILLYSIKLRSSVAR